MEWIPTYTGNVSAFKTEIPGTGRVMCCTKVYHLNRRDLEDEVAEG